MEPRYPFKEYWVLLITDREYQRQGQAYPTLYQIIEETEFFDYLNYEIAAGGSLTVTLNGTPPAGMNIHVPNLTSSGPLEIHQAWIMPDSLDLAISVSVRNVQLYYLNPSGTRLTPLSASLGSFGIMDPIYSYGSNNYPTLTLYNLNPAVPLAALFPNQGVQVWGYTYRLEPLSESESRKYLESGKFTAITLLPTLRR